VFLVPAPQDVAVVMAIDLALIGTTDIPYKGRAEDVAIDGAEIQYLLRALSRYVRTAPQDRDIVHCKPRFQIGQPDVIRPLIAGAGRFRQPERK
jgi:glycerol-3-phosphate dehydrogenase